MNAIRVTLSDDHPVVLAGIKVLLSDAKHTESDNNGRRVTLRCATTPIGQAIPFPE